MNKNLQVILTSGLILFLELSLIRFLPAYILYFGFFTNFVLLASFFGIGLGFILTKIKYNLINFFPILLFCLIVLVKFFSIGVDLENNQIIFFKGETDDEPFSLPAFILLPLLYLIIASTFACLSQTLGRLFSESTRPVKTYTLDILGSILGILLFYLLSIFFSFPPPVWFFLFSVCFLPLVFKRKKILVISLIFLLATILISIDTGTERTFWSPYSKLTLFLDSDGGGNLLANNIHHQFFSRLKGAQFYLLTFGELKKSVKMDEILIIGPGTGQDVTAALTFGAQHIDAVDIDPKILEIGRNYHPEHPYQNPKVTQINDDGRHYLKTTTKKYDLIILALTDSLAINASLGEVRLESYLFTTDGFTDARNRLKPDGAFVMYNNYREDWLINRLKEMLTQSFGRAPEVIPFSTITGAVLIAKQSTLPPLSPTTFTNNPSDNWPFLYLKEPGIPLFYIPILAITLVLSIGLVLAALSLNVNQAKWSLTRGAIFFLLGAAFALLETKSIVQLNLLFGATWFVNVIAFIGILLTVLAACLVTLKWRFNNLWLTILLILISLLIQFLFPLKELLNLSPEIRFIASIPFFYAPIFFANLFFTSLFQHGKNPQLDFGFNLLGLVLGGMIEYLSLVTGYSNLSLIAALFYLLAGALAWYHKGTAKT